jgi:hypothetical protein
MAKGEKTPLAFFCGSAFETCGAAVSDLACIGNYSDTMRSFLLLLTLIVSALCSHAEDFRKWTDAESTRQIDAKIVDKKLDNSEAKLLMRDGSSLWLKTARFVKDDQMYIERWVKPVDHITARIVAFGDGWKKIEVTAVAGSRPLTVKAYWGTGKEPKGYPKVVKLKRGEEKSFTYKASNKYRVKGWAGDELVDEERWDTKTGL